MPKRLSSPLAAAWVAAAVLILLSATASAQWMPKFGARAASMGGSFTAVANDGTAVAWNPAGLASAGKASVVATLGVDADDRGDFVNSIDELSALLDDPHLLDIISDVTRAIELLVAMDRDAAGATATATGGFFAAAAGRAGFGTYETGHAFAIPRIDKVHLRPTLDPADSILYNTTDVRLEGVRLRHYAFSFAQPLDPRYLTAGVTLRYVRGTSYFVDKTIPELSGLDGRDIIDEATEKNAFKQTHFDWDAGVMLRVNPKVQIGLAGHDLDAPVWKLKDGGEFKIPRRYRAGIAVSPGANFTIAGDYDLSKSPTGIEGIEGREISAGVEKFLADRKFAVRGGAALRRIDDGENNVTFFGGIGFGNRRAQLDLVIGGGPSSSDIALGFDLVVRQ